MSGGEILLASMIAAQTATSAYQAKRNKDLQRKQMEQARKESEEAERKARQAEAAARAKQEESQATELGTAAEEDAPLSVKRRLRITGSGENV
jgi:hypothetical protein